MKVTYYAVTIDVAVYDEQQLFDAALASLMEEGHPGDVEDFLGTKDEPDIGGCLIQLLDPGMSPPGTSIIVSSVQLIAEES